MCWAVDMDGVFKLGCINVLASKLLVVISRLGTLSMSPKKDSCLLLVHREKKTLFLTWCAGIESTFSACGATILKKKTNKHIYILVDSKFSLRPFSN